MVGILGILVVARTQTCTSHTTLCVAASAAVQSQCVHHNKCRSECCSVSQRVLQRVLQCCNARTGARAGAQAGARVKARAKSRAGVRVKARAGARAGAGAGAQAGAWVGAWAGAWAGVWAGARAKHGRKRGRENGQSTGRSVSGSAGGSVGGSARACVIGTALDRADHAGARSWLLTWAARHTGTSESGLARRGIGRRVVSAGGQQRQRGVGAAALCAAVPYNTCCSVATHVLQCCNTRVAALQRTLQHLLQRCERNRVASNRAGRGCRGHVRGRQRRACIRDTADSIVPMVPVMLSANHG